MVMRRAFGSTSSRTSTVEVTEARRCSLFDVPGVGTIQAQNSILFVVSLTTTPGEFGTHGGSVFPSFATEGRLAVVQIVRPSRKPPTARPEEHTSAIQSQMRTS